MGLFFVILSKYSFLIYYFTENTISHVSGVVIVQMVFFLNLHCVYVFSKQISSYYALVYTGTTRTYYYTMVLASVIFSCLRQKRAFVSIHYSLLTVNFVIGLIAYSIQILYIYCF